MRPLLAISGKRFSGKDTFAALLVESARTRGAELTRHAFAAESKRMFVDDRRRAGVGVDLDRLTSYRAYNERWRPELTRFTVDAIARDPLVFCREVADRIERSPERALVTDLRLALELRELRRRFALRVIRMERPDALRATSGWRYDPAVDGHHTETELDDPSLWDAVVRNDVGASELRAQADAIIAAHLG